MGGGTVPLEGRWYDAGKIGYIKVIAKEGSNYKCQNVDGKKIVLMSSDRIATINDKALIDDLNRRLEGKG